VFVGYIDDNMSAIVAVLPQPGSVPGLFRITRCVVLPDYQGLGLVNIMNEWIGELYWSQGKKRLSIVTTHPGLIKSYLRSDKWKLQSMDKGVKLSGNFDKNILSTRLKASFLYLPKNKEDSIWDIL